MQIICIIYDLDMGPRIIICPKIPGKERGRLLRTKDFSRFKKLNCGGLGLGSRVCFLTEKSLVGADDQHFFHTLDFYFQLFLNI